MSSNHFITKEGLWVGEGTILLSEAKERLQFLTKWVTHPEEVKGFTEAIQTVEMKGSTDQMKNQFRFKWVTPKSFEVLMKNNLVTGVEGTGVIEKDKVAWEYRGNAQFEGFEVYERQQNGDYLFHAEYVSTDQLRSIIEGRIWKKEGEKSPS